MLAFVLEKPLALGITGPNLTQAAVSVIWLGLIGSGLAFLAFFRLLGRWGAARTSLVAYLLPVWGIILGAIVLHEQIPPQLLLGTALVIGGISLVNARREQIVGLANRLRGRPTTDPATEATALSEQR